MHLEALDGTFDNSNSDPGTGSTYKKLKESSIQLLCILDFTLWKDQLMIIFCARITGL